MSIAARLGTTSTHQEQEEHGLGWWGGCSINTELRLRGGHTHTEKNKTLTRFVEK